MRDMTGIKVDEEVRVFDVNGRRLGQPEDGWPGRVTTVGRKLFVVKYCRYPEGQVFRMESGNANGKWGHQSVKTLAQAEDDLLRDTATAALRRCGLQFTSSGLGALYSTEALERVADAAVAALEYSGMEVRGDGKVVRAVEPEAGQAGAGHAEGEAGRA